MDAARLARVLFGTDEAAAERIALAAGPLALTWQGARLWDIHCNGHEVWHGVAFLYRDADWGTPEPVVDRVESTIGKTAFGLRITGHFAVEPIIDFRLAIDGDASGRVTFSGEAIPRGDIEASRLGLCVMHPMSACGATVEVEHTDGRISHSTFPRLIPQWPPFMLIRALRHAYAPDAFARCAFEGDVFELEDQRNNADASFKTYSRSNLMPRPYWLRAGVPVRQSVTLQVERPGAGAIASASALRRETAEASPVPRRGSVVRVSIGSRAHALPNVGIEISPADANAGKALHAALRELRPAHLHLALDDPAMPVDWHGVGRLLTSASATLRLDVTVDYARPEADFDSLRRALQDAHLAPSHIAVFPSEAWPLAAARAALPGALVGGGTPYFFVQLNRIERLGQVDFLTFTTSSIVHGADDESVMLTLQSLPSIIATLRATHPGARIAVGPSAIAARRSPLGRQPITDGSRRVALAQNDPRARGLYGAAWMLGYVAQLATAGIDALTLLALRGANGVVAEQGDALVRHPAFFALGRLRGAARAAIVSVSEPASVAALVLDREEGWELLLANLTGAEVRIEIEGWTGASSCAVLDADACMGIAADGVPWRARRTRMGGTPLSLGPYAIASLVRKS